MFQLFIDLLAEFDDPVFGIDLAEGEISHFGIIADHPEFLDLLVEKFDVFLNYFIAVLAVKIIHDNIPPANRLSLLVDVGDNRK